MTGEILLAIGTGLFVNEFCDVTPWFARKLVRWSAFCRYSDRARAAARAEELAAAINERPGSLLKLITAVGFLGAAIMAAAHRAHRTHRAPAPGTGSATDIAQDTPENGDRLTWRRQTMLKAINDYSEIHGCSPSNREIAEAVGLKSASSVLYHLRELRAAGYVTYDEQSPRTVRLVSKRPDH